MCFFMVHFSAKTCKNIYIMYNSLQENKNWLLLPTFLQSLHLNVERFLEWMVIKCLSNLFLEVHTYKGYWTETVFISCHQ